jgi:hypothetical protein
MRFTIALLALTLSAQTRSPILLELFTSEGCNSCPPADNLLAQLDQQPLANADLIVLSEHVDYWDGAWRDRFSSSLFTKRQYTYARHFGLNGVYTPQLVVDGAYELVGSNTPGVRQAIERSTRHAKLPLSLTVSQLNSRLKATISAPPTPSATLYVAIADSAAQSSVTRGENAGVTLRHVAVVRSLTAVGPHTSDAPREVELPLPNQSHAPRVVAFLQHNATGHILAVAQFKLTQ